MAGDLYYSYRYLEPSGARRVQVKVRKETASSTELIDYICFMFSGGQTVSWLKWSSRQFIPLHGYKTWIEWLSSSCSCCSCDIFLSRTSQNGDSLRIGGGTFWLLLHWFTYSLCCVCNQLIPVSISSSLYWVICSLLLMHSPRIHQTTRSDADNLIDKHQPGWSYFYYTPLHCRSYSTYELAKALLLPTSHRLANSLRALNVRR